MSLHVFLFLLVVCLFLSLALLWRLGWLSLQPSHSPAGKRRPLVPRLLKPRTPLACPICVERIQTFRPQVCHTPLYRLETPSQQIAVVLSALAEGLDLSASERVFDYRRATITTWLTRALEHAQSLHERFFRTLHPPYL
jgi:hypothetical protein